MRFVASMLRLSTMSFWALRVVVPPLFFFERWIALGHGRLRASLSSLASPMLTLFNAMHGDPKARACHPYHWRFSPWCWAGGGFGMDAHQFTPWMGAPTRAGRGVWLIIGLARCDVTHFRVLPRLGLMKAQSQVTVTVEPGSITLTKLLSPRERSSRWFHPMRRQANFNCPCHGRFWHDCCSVPSGVDSSRS